MRAAAKQTRHNIALGLGEHLPNSIGAVRIIMGGDQQGRTFGQAIGQCRFGLKAFVIQSWRKRNGPVANITRGTAHQGYIRADAGAHHDQTARVNMSICRQPVDPNLHIVNRQIPVARAAGIAVAAQINIQQGITGRLQIGNDRRIGRAIAVEHVQRDDERRRLFGRRIKVASQTDAIGSLNRDELRFALRGHGKAKREQDENDDSLMKTHIIDAPDFENARKTYAAGSVSIWL